MLEPGFVVAQYSSLTLVEHGGRLRPLGQGSLLGLGGDTVAVGTCEMRVLDVRTSEISRVIELGPEASQLDDPGRISPEHHGGQPLVLRAIRSRVPVVPAAPSPARAGPAPT